MSSPRGVAALLGGTTELGRQVRSAADLRDLVREGLPFAAVDALARMCGLTQETIARLLGVSVRNLQRWRGKRLTAEASDRLYRFARVLAHALDVFEDPGRVAEWLRSPIVALGKEAPLDLLDTDVGAQQVDEVLGRIEHGVIH